MINSSRIRELQYLSKKALTFREEMNCETLCFAKTLRFRHETPPVKNHEKVVHENPHATIEPMGLLHEVGDVSVPQSEQRNGVKAYPDCIQSGMYASGAPIPTEMQLSGLERRQNSVICSCKTVRTVRNESEN